MIKWLFFDVGDVLFDEDTPHLYYFHSLLLAMRRHGVDATWDAYHARIMQIAAAQPADAILGAVRSFVPDEAMYQSIYHAGREEYLLARKPRPYGLLLDGILPVVQSLATEFKIGVIANQHPQIVDAINDYGLGKSFDVVVIDEIVGVAKPDPAIFKIAFDRAGCTAGEALMIGDRCDNDILPARALGMPTLRFRRGILYSCYTAQTPEERADREVRTVGEIEAAIHEIARYVPGA